MLSSYWFISMKLAIRTQDKKKKTKSLIPEQEKVMDQLMKYWFSSSPYQDLAICLLLLLPLLYGSITKLIPTPKRLNLPPSPPALPVIGNLHQIGPLIHRSFRDLSTKYGPLMLLKFGSFPTLVVQSAEVLEEIIKQHDEVFSNRPFFVATDLFAYGGRDVIFCPYGDAWRQSRKICVLQLLSQKMVKELRSIREEEIADMRKEIDSSFPNGSTVNMNELFYTLAVNVICRSAAGDKVYAGAYRKLVRDAHSIVQRFCFADSFPYLKWMDRLTGYTASLQSSFKDLEKILDQMIDDQATKIANDIKPPRKNFTHILLRLQRDGKLDIYLERENIKGIIQSMFGAGIDPLASNMEWTMAELAKNPKVMQKAQDEVRRVVGDKGKLDESDIVKMKYLKCVIKETLRLHGSGIFPRQTAKRMKLCGYDIPPKTRVIINNWASQRDPKVWERPEEFVPERFMEVESEFKGKTPKYIPFGFGRRICPGMNYAITLVETVLAHLLYHYDWMLPEGVTPESMDMSERFAQAIHLKNPLRLVPVPRFHSKQ